MTNFINQLTINGEVNTFFNYVNPVDQSGEPRTFGGAGWLDDVLTAAYGNTRSVWTPTFNTQGAYNIRFPVPWETLTGDVSSSASIGSGMRGRISNRRDFPYTNTTNADNTSTFVFLGTDGNTDTAPYTFGVLNKYSFSCVAFTGANRSGNFFFKHFGWAKDRQYTGGVYPRSLIGISSCSNIGYFSAGRVSTENGNTATYFLTTQPAISCLISTPGANSNDIILQDNISPNNYIGKAWNLIRLPSSAVVGKIYKNTGADPDTGNVETDQKRFYMCVGTWGVGGEKFGMRLWTENIT